MTSARCKFCREVFWDGRPEYIDGPLRSSVCEHCMGDMAQPETLRALAAWFDSPHRTPAIRVDEVPPVASPGMLLRMIADQREGPG